jgi:hypothetical protein
MDGVGRKPPATRNKATEISLRIEREQEIGRCHLLAVTIVRSADRLALQPGSLEHGCDSAQTASLNGRKAPGARAVCAPIHPHRWSMDVRQGKERGFVPTCRCAMATIRREMSTTGKEAMATKAAGRQVKTLIFQNNRLES